MGAEVEKKSSHRSTTLSRMKREYYACRDRYSMIPGHPLVDVSQLDRKNQ